MSIAALAAASALVSAIVFRPKRIRCGDLRVAVHEAGHFVAAWSCTAISGVNEIVSDDECGHIEYAFVPRETLTPDIRWCDAVISLAGFAAEMYVFGNARSANSYSDLLCARMVIDESVLELALSHRHRSCVDFNEAYRPRLTPSETIVLSSAYAHARCIIESHGDMFHRVVDALVKSHTLTRQDVAMIMPERTMFNVVGATRATFVLPCVKEKP